MIALFLTKPVFATTVAEWDLNNQVLSAWSIFTPPAKSGNDSQERTPESKVAWQRPARRGMVGDAASRSDIVRAAEKVCHFLAESSKWWFLISLGSYQNRVPTKKTSPGNRCRRCETHQHRRGVPPATSPTALGCAVCSQPALSRGINGIKSFEGAKPLWSIRPSRLRATAAWPLLHLHPSVSHVLNANRQRRRNDIGRDVL